MKNVIDNALAFLNTRKELDAVVFSRQRTELNQRLNILASNIMTLKELKMVLSFPDISEQDAQLARDLYGDLQKQIMHAFKYDILS
jgi:capsid portal protein